MIYCKNTTVFKKIAFLAVVCSLLMVNRVSAAPVPGGSQRYVALMLLNLSQSGEEESKLIKEAHTYGMNSVYLTIHWDTVYPDSSTGAPNWSKYDAQIALAINQGMSVAIRVHVSRSKHRLNGFWSWANDGLKDHLGISHMGAYQASTFRYNYMPAVHKAAGFVHELVSRYKWVHNQGKLLFVSVTNTPEQEAGYPYENFEPDTDHPLIYHTNFDCSDQSMNEFKAWLTQRYGKIHRLNAAWGTNYSSFSEAHPRIAFWEPMETYQSRSGKDWYRYSHENLKRYTEVLIDAVKSVNPGIRYISDYGSVHNRICNVRGTVLFGDLNTKGDGVKVNDASQFDHRFTMDVVRGGLPSGAFVANEVFLREDTPFEDIQRQIDGNFGHGAHMVAFVTSTLSSFSRAENMVRSAVSNWQGVPRPLYDDESGPVVYNTSDAIDFGIDTQVYAAWRAIALADPDNSRPTKVIPDNDIFSEDFWSVAANIPPRLVTALPEQKAKTGLSFEYTLPIDNFSDEDGWIAGMEVSALPDGLTFDGEKIHGTPGGPGSVQVTVTAIDDEGGTVTTTLPLLIQDPGSLDVTYHDALQARLAEPTTVSLTWSTVREVNSSHFEVQRSTDGASFGAIGRVQTRQNAETLHTYKWDDEDPAGGLNYYRLKATDLDGTYTYTEIVSVDVPLSEGQGVIFPNPASERFYVLKEKPVHLELQNLSGQKVEETLSDSMLVKHLTSGIYLVKVSYESGKTETYRLIVE